MEGFQLLHRDRKTGPGLTDVTGYGPECTQDVLRFHASFPGYTPTPLVKLDQLAHRLGVAGIWVKDESRRFDLNAFKVLGGSYAVGRAMAERLGVALDELPYRVLTSQEVKAKLGELTLITATDGNHGRGVAWTANRLGQRSVVYMPKGTAQERLDHIRALGSDASITDLCYDDTVRLARREAEEKGYLLVQDTSWEGYEKIPGWIMEGYTTIGREIVDQLGSEKPTHIFLQAGVGSMAGALAGFFAALYGDKERPIITVVEPNSADCIFCTAKADDGKMRFSGEMHTIMAGLACGEPCPLAWDILRDYAENFISMPDRCAANGMRVLGNPLPGDEKIVSGESGASGFGAVYALLADPDLAEQRKLLGLDENARVLCLSTEGATDRENYRRIVWEGAYSL